MRRFLCSKTCFIDPTSSKCPSNKGFATKQGDLKTSLALWFGSSMRFGPRVAGVSWRRKFRPGVHMLVLTLYSSCSCIIVMSIITLYRWTSCTCLSFFATKDQWSFLVSTKILFEHTVFKNRVLVSCFCVV